MVHPKRIEYILERNLDNPSGMNFVSPFQPKRDFNQYFKDKSDTIETN